MTDIASLIQEWNGESVLVERDAESGAWIVIALHSTTLGPATGGTRIKHYPSLGEAVRDALRLSEGMTYKFATPNLPWGGAKAVISLPADFDPSQRAALLRRYGNRIAQLGGRFRTGPDVGSSPEDMNVIAETAGPFVFAKTVEAGGGGDPGPFTAIGVLTAMETACEIAFGSSGLADRRIAVQGAGDVGDPLIRHLVTAGAEVVFTEVARDLIGLNRDERGLEFIDPDEIYDVECDVFSPCAFGGVLNRDTIGRLRCRVVAGSANNQLEEPDDADRLRAAGVLYAPDFVANVGGAMALPIIEMEGVSAEDAERQIREYVGAALRRIFEQAESADISTAAAATRLARANLAAADGRTTRDSADL